jgi:hypothetical protein
MLYGKTDETHESSLIAINLIAWHSCLNLNTILYLLVHLKYCISD